MARIAGQTAVVSGPSGAFTAGGSHYLRPWRVPALLGGAALACIATLTVATLPGPTALNSRPLLSRHGLQSHTATRLPLGLAAAASTSVGASERSFWPVRHGASLLARGGGIHSTFNASGATVRVAQGTLGLSLTGVGRGQRLASVTAVAPTGAADEVLYQHGSISEFYRNGLYGVEQGFTVLKPQAGSGSLVLALGIKGSLVPEQVGSQVLFRTRAGATALRYGQLSAVDATGRRLPAEMQVRNGTLRLQINDTNARYPLRIDPFIQQGEKLIGSGQVNDKEFGGGVALSGDGNTALIGGGGDNTTIGAAWVFTRSGSTWTQQGAKLTGGGEIGQGGFGSRVALSFDGNTALIGGPGDHASVGAAWVFTRSGETWTQQGGKLAAKGLVAGNGFGSAIALSSDGNTALIGCGGVAWVFTRSGSTWTQQSEMLVGSERVSSVGPGGGSVALSSDGNTALIGFPIDNSTVGAAWVFTRSGSTWTQQGSKLTGSGEVGKGYFGWSVALSGDGNTVLIGGTNDGIYPNEVGAAWVFTRSGSTWTQQGAKLTGSGEVYQGYFGVSVALSGDGNTALIGGPYDGGYGAVWVFTRSGSTWSQQGAKLTGSGEVGNDEFGSGVALSSDANTALIASPGNNEFAGAAWVFVNAPAAAPVNTGLPVISGLNGLPIGNTVGALQTMLCSTGIWTGNPIPSSFTYLWLRDGTGIGGATGSTYFVQEADRGYTLTCEVTASNSVGHQAATSLGVAYPAPPFAWVPPAGYSGGGYSGGGYSGGGNTGASGSVLGSTTASISTAQIAALLGQQLTPSGKAAKIAALLKSGGFTLSFKALEAGTAMIDWYEVPLGAKLAKAKAKPVLVAAGQRTFFAAGTAKITIKLTAAGKRLLKHAKQLKLTGKGTFTPTGKPHITTTKVFVLKH